MNASHHHPAPDSPTRVGANAPEEWDRLWANAETRDWRGDVMESVYERIAFLIPKEGFAVDVGGGVGMLAKRLVETHGIDVEVWEHNQTAIAACKAKNLQTRSVDLERAFDRNALSLENVMVIATEVIEHLSNDALEWFMDLAKKSGAPCFFSVPNDRLPPEEEPQHARSWTALGFLTFLRRWWPDARVEVLGPPANNPAFPSFRGQPAFLLGVCGMPKKDRVSVCWPARDEGADIEKCLASFRGFADEMVIGIDPRSTDATRTLAEKYAEIVFDLTELQGPPGDQTPPGGFHFAHARNQCMDRCMMPWIFMTEAHEPIVEGQDVLLHLDQLAPYIQGAHVVRQGGRVPFREQWLFPWISRNRPDIRYERSTHNSLNYGDHAFITLPQVKTLHERVHERTGARAKQRKVQNRLKLMDDWVRNGNVWSLSYLGSEWREYSSERAIQYLREYLAVGKFGVLRYHTRLVLAKELMQLGRVEEAKEALHPASADDWSRIEHWIQLGDIAFDAEDYAQALTFYEYACTKRKNAPLTTWWVDLAMYSWIPAQRMAQVHAALGNAEKSLEWGEHVLEEFLSFGDDEALEPYITEAKVNIDILKGVIHEQRQAAE